MSAETFSYKGISAGKYIEGEIEALNQEEASFKLKEQKIIITNLARSKKKKAVKEKKMFCNDGWRHDPGSALVGWTKQVAESRLVYLQGGDDPVAYASPEYQRLIQNAVHWVADA